MWLHWSDCPLAPVDGKVVLAIMHQRVIIVVESEMRDVRVAVELKVVTLIEENIVPVDFDVVIAIRSRLFVVQADGVEDLMFDNSVVHAMRISVFFRHFKI